MRTSTTRSVDPSDEIVRRKTAARELGVSTVTLWRWEKSGRFPRAIKLGPHVDGWRRSTLRAWVANRELESIQVAEAVEERG